MATVTSPMLHAALSYARRGWRVLPLHTPIIRNGSVKCTCGKGGCKKKGKHPRFDADTLPHGAHSASSDPDVIRAWWSKWPDANVGIATGEASGFFVVDVDPRNGGDVSLLALEQQHGPLPHTVESLTGGGGRHLGFARNGHSIGNGADKLGPGIDVKGDGDLIVAPPSLHESGRRYLWEASSHPDDVPIADVPDWLAALLSNDAPRPGRNGHGDTSDSRIPDGSRNGHSDAYAHAALDSELIRLSTATEGTRNEQLNRSAFALGQLVSVGALDRATVETQLTGAALAVGLGEHETTATIKSGIEAGMKEPRVIPERAAIVNGRPNAELLAERCELSDMGNSRRLALRYSDRLRYVQAWGWLVWDGHHWQRDATGEVMRLARATVRAIFDEAKDAASEDTAARIGKWAAASQNRSRIDAMIGLAQSEPEIATVTDAFDRDPMLLNAANGVIDLRTGELQPHAADSLSTKITSVEYDPNAECPTWLTFLDRIMDGNTALINCLQRAAGYSLTGDTSEQCLFLCYGTGANGKSTFLETLRAAAGDYAQVTEFSSFLDRHGDMVRNDIARMVGARCITAIEVGEGRRLAEVLVKALTGGDTIAARFLHREYFEFRPAFKAWLAANHKPIIRGTDLAIWRRIRLIPFTVTIPENERDPRMADRLRAELPGILAWAVRGCLAWQSDGLGVPNEVRVATDTYRAEQDVIAAFIDERCVVTPNAETKASKLYEAYKAWAEASSEYVENQRAFGLRLAERGFESKRTSGGSKAWRGIGLLPSE